VGLSSDESYKQGYKDVLKRLETCLKQLGRLNIDSLHD
jgi:hypothetical protein